MSDDENDKSKNLINQPKKDIFSFDSGDMAVNIKMAEMMAQSGCVPDLYTAGFKGKSLGAAAGAILVAIQMGRELGLTPAMALQGIAVINGRPSVWGDAMIGLVRQSSLCEYIKEEFNHDTMTATCTAKRVGEPAQSREFSAHDAETAGLWGRNKPSPWACYPKVMLKHRARGFCLRDLFADVLKGLSLAEEIEDYQDLKQINDAPAKSDKANKAASFIKEQIEDGEIEEVVDYSEQIENCESLAELVTLKTLLVQVPKGDYYNRLTEEYNAKGRDLYQKEEIDS